MPPRALYAAWLALALVQCFAAAQTKLSLEDAIRNSLRAPEPSPAPTLEDPIVLTLAPPTLTLAPAAAVAPVAPATPAAPVAPVMATAAPVADATATPQPTTYKNVTSDMKLVIKEVGQVTCPEDVRKNSFAIYKNNRVMFDTCTRESKYQLLPHEEGVPDMAQTTALVTSKACVDLFSGILLAGFPECDINNFSIRSAAESLFRIRKDVLAGRGAPTQRQFDEFYNLNRVINLLAENASLIESVFARHANRVSLSEMKRMMNRIDIDPAVSIAEDMTISVARDKTLVSATDSAANSNGASVILPSANTTTTTSAARKRQSAGTLSLPRVVLVAIVSVLILWS